MKPFYKKLQTWWRNRSTPLETARIPDNDLRGFFNTPKRTTVESLEGWAGTLREHILKYEDVDDPTWLAETDSIITTMRGKLNQIEGKYELRR